MKLIERKLRSQSGASMILALVFLMFCSFVGSTVLVSATANAYRVNHLADQQNYLTERSTALVITDELQLNEHHGTKERLQMNIVKSLQTIKAVTVGGDGSVHETGEEKQKQVIRIQVITTDPDITPLQRLMLEATVWRYIREFDVNTARDEIELVGFPQSTDTNPVTKLENFWFQPSLDPGDQYKVAGSMTVGGDHVSGQMVELPSYTVRFSSGRGDDIYDFRLDFGDFSHLKVVVNAFSGKASPITLKGSPEPDTEGLFSTGYIQVTSQTTQTVISWNDPTIEKGGSES